MSSSAPAASRSPATPWPNRLAHRRVIDPAHFAAVATRPPSDPARWPAPARAPVRVAAPPGAAALLLDAPLVEVRPLAHYDRLAEARRLPTSPTSGWSVHLARLKLTRLPDCLDGLAEEATKAKWTYVHFLDHLLTAEIAARTERDITMKTKLARFPFVKTLEEFDFAYQPSVDRAPDQGTGHAAVRRPGRDRALLGPPGTGKAHLAISLGVRAISQGVSVSFVGLADLLTIQLHRDAKEDRLGHRLQVRCAGPGCSSSTRWATSRSTASPPSSSSNW